MFDERSENLKAAHYSTIKTIDNSKHGKWVLNLVQPETLKIVTLPGFCM